MSKVDPTEFKNLDRRSTILLQAARKQTEGFEEKSASGIEDPGIDALRGSFGTVGSIIRARSARRVSQSSRGTAHSSRFGAANSHRDVEQDQRNLPPVPADLGHYGAMKRHQLFDPPVPHLDIPEFDAISMSSQPSVPKPTIKFGEQDVVHSYHRDTAGRDDLATHERRAAPHGTNILASPSSYIQSAPPGNTRGNMPAQRQSPDSPTSGHRSRHDPESSGLHSAPPRVGVPAGFYSDPYTGSSMSATLPSFRSGMSLDDDSEPQRQQHGRFSRQPSSRDYPKVNAEDAEERMSLWDPRRDNSSEVDVGVSPESPPGTIRLVSSRGGHL
jgi:magnesium transporter